VRNRNTGVPFFWSVLWFALSISAAALFLIPILWVFAGTFKNQFDIFSDVRPPSIWTFVPRHPTLANIQDSLFSGGSRTEEGGGLGLAGAFVNSAIVSICQVALTLLLCSLAAYAFSRLRFRGRNLLFFVLILALAIPLEVVLVPLYRIASGLGLTDNLIGVFLPFVAQPLGLFLLRQAFDDLPRDLDDAATIDGASHFQILYRILLPNLTPALTTVAILTFLFSWNAFLWPLVIINNPQNQLVQVAVAQAAGAPGHLPNWGVIMASASLTMVPVLMLFLFLQRYFVRGIASTGLKG
jgi:ABC-type glycerol-3-phosphate transport system permease component